MYNKTYKLAWAILGSLILPAKIYAENTIDNALHDPTRPAAYSDTTTTHVPNGDITISAIFANDADHKIVMIGDHLFTLGEKVSESTIIAIDNTGITLKKDDGTEFRVVLPYPTIKIPTNNRKGTP